MRDGSGARTALVILTSVVSAGAASAAVTGNINIKPMPSAITLASNKLPGWNISEICASDSARGQCRILEAEALRTLTGGWDAVPENFRSDCLANIKSPYDHSYRLLSQCLEAQVIKGYARVAAAGNVRTETALPAATATKVAQVATPAAAATTATGLAVLPTTSVGDLFKAREAWGKGAAASEVAAPLAAGAVSPLPQDKFALPKGFEGQPTIHPLQATPLATLTPAAEGQIADAMKKLLAEREGWLTAQTNVTAPAAPASTAPAATGYAVLPTNSVEDLFKAREAWGAGPAAKEIAAPLATGAYSPLPSTGSEPPKGFAGQPTMHPLEATPPAKLTPVPEGQIAEAMKKLLAERESWLKAPAGAAAAPAPKAAPEAAATAPAAPQAAAPSSTGYAILPTTSVADLFKAREAWGTGAAAKKVAAPLAKGAVSPLPQGKFKVAKGFEGQPTVHALQATPVAELTPVPGAQLADAMKKLLATRDGWGTAPSKPSAAAPAKAADAPKKSAEAADCEAKLKEAASAGVILFRSSSARIDDKSNRTLDALAKVAKGCSKGRIRVEGHTDSTGRAEYNKKLSQQRAEAVASYLTKAGMPKDRVEAVGYGQEKPVASNDTTDGRAKNRRIEFTVID